MPLSHMSLPELSKGIGDQGDIRVSDSAKFSST